MEGVTKGLDKAMKSMDLEKVWPLTSSIYIVIIYPEQSRLATASNIKVYFVPELVVVTTNINHNVEG